MGGEFFPLRESVDGVSAVGVAAVFPIEPLPFFTRRQRWLLAAQGGLIVRAKAAPTAETPSMLSRRGEKKRRGDFSRESLPTGERAKNFPAKASRRAKEGRIFPRKPPDERLRG
jgi:hypothetical protein